MTTQISSPDQTATRSVIADWLELIATLLPRGAAGKSDLFGILDFLEDKAAESPSVDAETGDPLDRDILEEQRQSQLADVFDELAYRAQILGVSYPFSLDETRGLLTRNFAGLPSDPGHVVYLFCLVTTALRTKQITLESEKLTKELQQDIPNAFQACACIAAGGYMGGSVASFGFPRASGTGFHEALRGVYKRFGAGVVTDSENLPEGLPTQQKDGGIDVIAWRDLPDRMPGKLYLIGQCASGSNWREKSVVPYIDQFHGAWFTQAPAKNSFPAMFIPFPLQHDLDPPRSGPFIKVLHNKFWFDEMQFGIVFDRLRITSLASQYMVAPIGDGEVEGVTEFKDVQDWVGKLLSAARQAAG